MMTTEIINSSIQLLFKSIRKQDPDKVYSKHYRRLPRKIRKSKLKDFSGFRTTGYYRRVRTNIATDLNK